MIDTIKQTASKGVLAGKQRTYNEISELLDKKWDIPQNERTIERMMALDKALGNPSQKVKTILFAGTNGKSLSAYFTSKLLKTENLKIGTFFTPHFLSYKEHFVFNDEMISNKAFTEVANEVIFAADNLGLKFSAQEILTEMAFLYFVQQGADVALMEVSKGGKFNPVNICNVSVAVITRIVPVSSTVDAKENDAAVKDIMGIVKKGTYVASGDQNKNNLNLMQEIVKEAGAHWAMPIRKLAALRYPYEQIHGRCAALAERASQLFVEKVLARESMMIGANLLTRPKGQRGRPTLEEKRLLETSPKKTLEQFWKEVINDLPSRFQLLDKEKPSVLLDNAQNLDSFKNLLLGIRLLHYQHPVKGLALIIGATKNSLHSEEFTKLVRYFFKKTAGQLFICPIESNPIFGETDTWDVEKVSNDMKALKIKVKACNSFDDAFEQAKKAVDERNGLIVLTGSNSVIYQFWKNKGKI